MTGFRPSSETMAVATLTVVSLVGGLAVACVAGAGASGPGVKHRSVAASAAASPGSSAPAPAAPTALDSPELRYPADAVVDVKAAYHALGDGHADDTAALQAALSANPGRPLYLPAGTYLVRGALAARLAPLRLYGEKRDATVIRLADGAPGFGDPHAPRAVLRTATPGDGTLVDNLTVDAGTNPGAIGVDFAGGGTAAVRRTTIVGHGTVGLSMTRPVPGPALVSQVQVRGFDHGIRVGQYKGCVALEHVALSGQRVAGLSDVGNVLAVRDLTSVNAVPAVRSEDRSGLVTLTDAELTGGAPSASAVDSAGELLATRVSTDGYRSAVTQSGKVVAGAQVDRYVSHPALRLYPADPLDVPVRDAPEYLPGAADWASVTGYGAHPDDEGDDTAAVQAALDSGKPAVYLPAGRYVVSGTLRLHGGVRALVGFGATLVPGGTAFADPARPVPLVAVGDGGAPEVTVRGLTVARPAHGGAPGLVGFAHQTARPLVLTDVTCCGDYRSAYRADPGAGPLFVSDVTAARWEFAAGQRVYARELYAAGPGAGPRVVNGGATVWILGFAADQGGPAVRTQAGGVTELLGGSVADAGTDPAFECLDGAVYLSFVTIGPAGYRPLVRARRGGTDKTLPRQQGLSRADGGRTVALFAG